MRKARLPISLVEICRYHEFGRSSRTRRVRLAATLFWGGTVVMVLTLVRSVCRMELAGLFPSVGAIVVSLDWLGC